MPKRELAIDIILDAKRAERNLSSVNKQLNKLAKLELDIDNATTDKELQKVERKIQKIFESMKANPKMFEFFTQKDLKGLDIMFAQLGSKLSAKMDIQRNGLAAPCSLPISLNSWGNRSACHRKTS